MSTRVKVLWMIAASGCAVFAATTAQALTMQECSAKYKAAQTAGTLNGQKWNDFRKAECGTDGAGTPAAATAAPKPEAKSKSAALPAAAPAPAGNAVFPTAVDPKYAKETAFKARIHTCSDQWKANKASNANGGLQWVQPGGGYWPECNKKLKGST
jgi:hypothetical protein